MYYRQVKIPKRDGGKRTIFILEDARLIKISQFVSHVFHQINEYNISCTKSLPNIISTLAKYKTTEKPYTFPGVSLEIPQDIKNEMERARALWNEICGDIQCPIPYKDQMHIVVYESDIKDCFHSIDINNFLPRKEAVMEFLKRKKIPQEACFIKQNDKLLIPQGFPSSPALVNFFLGNIDKRIRAFLNSMPYLLHYLRYADNLFIIQQTQLPQEKIDHILMEISQIVYSKGLKLKHKFKIRQDILGVDPETCDISYRAFLDICRRKAKWNDHVKNGIRGYLMQFPYIATMNQKFFRKLFNWFERRYYGQNIHA